MHEENAPQVAGGSTAREVDARREFFELFQSSPVPPAERLTNLGLYLKRQDLSRILFIHELYRRILDVHGIVMEFGVRWGQNMALYSSFRGMYEPFNYNRKIVGFDTFEGFPSVAAEDGEHYAVAPGAYGVTDGYQAYLERVLDFHESESPISHKKKFELVRGDAIETVPAYLGAHPETVVALAYFDFDLYAPTKAALRAIRPHLTKGSVLAFDELNDEIFPGETVAVREILGLDRYRIQRTPLVPTAAFMVIE